MTPEEAEKQAQESAVENWSLTKLEIHAGRLSLFTFLTGAVFSVFICMGEPGKLPLFRPLPGIFVAFGAAFALIYGGWGLIRVAGFMARLFAALYRLASTPLEKRRVLVLEKENEALKQRVAELEPVTTGFYREQEEEPAFLKPYDYDAQSKLKNSRQP